MPLRILMIGWVAASAAGWAVSCGTVLRFAGFPYWFPAESVWERIAEGVLAGTGCGVIAGGAQWLVLRHRLRLSPAWISGACLAWAALEWANRFSLSTWQYYGVLTAGATLSAVVQVRLVAGRVSRPALWLLAATVSFIAGVTAGVYTGFWVHEVAVHASTKEALAFWAGGVAGGAVAGLTSAPFVAVMFRRLASLGPVNLSDFHSDIESET